MPPRRTISLVLVALSLAVADLRAQGVTVQQPTFSSFSVGTSVLVPDQGSAFMGGITRSATGVNEFGVPGLPFFPFRSRSIGQDQSAMGVSTHVFIHDFDAMDRMLLGGMPGAVTSVPRSMGPLPEGVVGPAVSPRAGNLAGQWQAKPASPALNLATEQARRAAEQQTRADEAEAFFDRAAQAEADGKPAVAKIYYQMAARRASGDLKQQALAKLQSLTSGSKIAQGQ